MEPNITDVSSQTEAIIEIIRRHPNITRSQLANITVNGFRIANVTARISNARRRLARYGEMIVCNKKRVTVGNKHIKLFTSYEIRPISNT
ncbi:MAG: hypothetical protein U0518_04590 [Candidatus Gracilibacteria bacterium]